MRPPYSRFVLAAALAALLAAPAAAQFGKPKVKIVNAKVGFAPAGGNEKEYSSVAAHVAKENQWAPVTFKLEIAGQTDRPLKVEVTTYDGDGYRVTSTVPLGKVVLNPTPTGADDQFRPTGSFVEPTELPFTVYARPGGQSGQVNLRILTDDPDGGGEPVSDQVRLETLRLRPPSTYVVLSLGSKLPKFGLYNPNPKFGEDQDETTYLRGGRVEVASIDSVEEMPDQWFGYSGVDLLVIGTGKPTDEFVTALFGESPSHAKRRRAVLEWVRRGGRVLVSVGEKADIVKASVAFKEMLPATIDGTKGETALNWRTPDSNFDSTLALPTPSPTKADPAPKTPTFPVAQFRPKAERPFEVLPTDRDGKRPLVVRSSYGLGKVTLAGVDLDRSPFTEGRQRTQIWQQLVKWAGSDAGPGTDDQPKNVTKYGSLTSTEEDGAAVALRQNTDAFEGVPVISFGWVALFILGYTAVIGPIEYIFLKKVLKRLELTWVTFPIIVLSVSAAAYFTAYAVKGKELKVNKVDVVDVVVEPSGDGRVYGRTWLTVFSPRIDSYTLGVEPKAEWAGTSADERPVTLVDWYGGTGGTGVAQSARSYRYVVDPRGEDRPAGSAANALAGVPIQVWSTKAFTANWSAPLPAAPPVTSTVRHPPADPTAAGGQITLNLPLTDIQEAVIMYAGKAYKLDRGLTPGQPVGFASGTRQVDDKWDGFSTNGRFEVDGHGEDPFARGRVRGEQNNTSTAANAAPLPLWALLFHEKALQSGSGGRPQNASLRDLDQSWRLTDKHTDELILLLKLRRTAGDIDALTNDPASASPTAMWLHAQPNGGPPPGVPGKLQQDTYVRIYIPVKAANAK